LGGHQIKMPTFNMPNSTRPDDIIIELATEVIAFPIMILVFVWGIVFIGGVTRQVNKQGYADFPQWALMASLTTTLLGIMITVRMGVIALPVLGIVVSVTILSAVWFFLSRGRFE